MIRSALAVEVTNLIEIVNFWKLLVRQEYVVIKGFLNDMISFKYVKTNTRDE